MLWFLAGVGLVVAVVAVRDLLRHPDATGQPDHRSTVPRGGDHTDWARARDGLDGAGSPGSNGGAGAR